MKVDLVFWLFLCLSLSVTLNILAFWYIRRVLDRLSFVNENINDLRDLIGTYQNHLSGIFSLEMYYGDSDIKTLLDHTRGLKAVLDEYNDVTTLLEPPEEYEEKEEQEEEEDATQEISKENVFYAGTRTSNN